MTYNAKQGLLVVVVKKRRMLPYEVKFRKTKMFQQKKNRWLFTGSHVEIEYTLNFNTSNVSPYLKTTYIWSQTVN